MTTIKNVTEGKKKLKSLIGFLNANKINNYNRVGKKKEKRGERENSTELQKPNIETKVYNSNKKCDREKKSSEY